LIRPMRLTIVGPKFKFEGPHVDTMCVYHSDTMKYLNKLFPSCALESNHMASVLTMMRLTA